MYAGYQKHGRIWGTKQKIIHKLSSIMYPMIKLNIYKVLSGVNCAMECVLKMKDNL